ncbi:MAG: Fic family protein [Patescibacteria group bacterium]|jgi:Fic family protein|nr:Fic family protein [Patescibacteria group bacterium]
MLKRKQIILNIIKEGSIGINDLLSLVNKKNTKSVSKITVIRDLDEFIDDKLVVRFGKGPSVKYRVSPSSRVFEEIDIDNYFSKDLDNRNATREFNFEIFELLKNINIFNDSQIDTLNELNKKYQDNINSLSSNIIEKEFERLMIELSWKSSKIEGNTYDLLETEFLIKENKEAKGHTKLEARMILNHKEAIEYVSKNKIKKINPDRIIDLHEVIIKDMDVVKGLRKNPVGITGTVYRPLEDKNKIREALNKICDLVNSKENILEKALLLNLLIAYLQPFGDGNKRTSRLMGNAILMVNDYCPLSFRSIDELEYKKAIIIFYEQNNLSYFRNLFIEQYSFAVENYFKS